ncbi:MAG: ABC transporter permease [Planctomycetota bacterium]
MPDAVATQNQKDVLKTLIAILIKIAPFIGLIFVWLLFWSQLGSRFANVPTQTEILLQSTIIGIAALGATIIIIAGGIDLSVGSTIAMVSMVLAKILHSTSMSPTLAVVLGLLAAAACGLAIGAMVVGHVGRVVAVVVGLLAGMIWLPQQGLGLALSIPIGVVIAVGLWFLAGLTIRDLKLAPFIVTLGMMGIIRGLAKMVGVYGNEQASTQITPSRTTWIDKLNAFQNEGPFSFILSYFPISVLLFAGLAIAMALMLRFTKFGRHIYAIGSNEETARLCGVNIARTKILIYTLGIALAGVAGVLLFAKIGQGNATEAVGYELAVIAAVVIGGASLSGGEGSILGTVIGALIMQIVIVGCIKMDMDNYVQEIITGAIIVAAVALDQLRHRRPT